MASEPAAHGPKKKRPRRQQEQSPYLRDDEASFLFVVRRIELEKGRAGLPRAATIDEILKGLGWDTTKGKVRREKLGRIHKMAKALRYDKERPYLESRMLSILSDTRTTPILGYRTWKHTHERAVISCPSTALLLVEMNAYPKLGDGSDRVEAKVFREYFLRKYAIAQAVVENDLEFAMKFGYCLEFGNSLSKAHFLAVHDRFDEERLYIEKLAQYAREFIHCKAQEAQS
jgi:hypothetical protein